jgi:15-cis-phytoene synthase
VSTAELRAAGIGDPWLCAAYQCCRRLHAAYGRTYFLATRLLTPARRPAVHALYGFARWVDEIVDAERPGADAASRAARLSDLEEALRAGLARSGSPHPVIAAVVDTAARYGIAHRHFAAFLRSMRMDLAVTSYPSYRALAEYVHGSAEVIGLQVLPVLGTVVPRERAEPHAAALGEAFQLTNFLRDVGEDLDRGRLYLPADELAAFGVDRELLLWCRRTGHTDPRVRRALAHLVARTRAVYRRARPGIGMLDPASRPCVATAYSLYGGILDAIVAAEYDVLGHRAVVSRRRRLAVVGPAVAGTALARGRRWLRR